tara:strand:+ start:5484 stop:6242 length:759 start_codon:yes stop_codon:yes gene_type:complete
MTEDEIQKINKFCERYQIMNYTINDDELSDDYGSIDVDGTVYLVRIGITKFPIKFNKVTGDFNCYSSGLTTLEGSPKYVGGNFDCSKTKLTDLKGSPLEVSGSFTCYQNKLTDLKGSPKEVGRDFNCQENKLTSLEGSPKEVGRDFNCQENKLTSLADGPENIGNNLCCNDNNIYNLKGLETKIKQYLTLDYNPIGILFADLEGDIINSFISFKVINERELNIKRLKYFLHTFGLDTSIHYDELKDKYTIKN